MQQVLVAIDAPVKGNMYRSLSRPFSKECGPLYACQCGKSIVVSMDGSCRQHAGFYRKLRKAETGQVCRFQKHAGRLVWVPQTPSRFPRAQLLRPEFPAKYKKTPKYGGHAACMFDASAWHKLWLPLYDHAAYAAFVRGDSLLLIAREFDRLEWNCSSWTSERPSHKMDGGLLTLYTVNVSTGKVFIHHGVLKACSHRWPWIMQSERVDCWPAYVIYSQILLIGIIIIRKHSVAAKAGGLSDMIWSSSWWRLRSNSERHRKLDRNNSRNHKRHQFLPGSQRSPASNAAKVC